MQAYTFHDLVNRTMLGDDKFYDSRDVNARIVELERALKSCAALLILDIREREKFLHQAKEAVREADAVLTVKG